VQSDTGPDQMATEYHNTWKSFLVSAATCHPEKTIMKVSFMIIVIANDEFPLSFA
jgi:hypothetical protein